MIAALGAAVLLAIAPGASGAQGAAQAIHLDVPVLRQSPGHCGPNALTMVLRFYGASSAAVGEADGAYDPALRGALITDLAAAARRAGYAAEIATPDADGLRGWLASGVPPILLVNGGAGPVARLHYLVVAGWEPAPARWVVLDGGATPRRMGEAELARRRRGSDDRALIVRPATAATAAPGAAP